MDTTGLEGLGVKEVREAVLQAALIAVVTGLVKFGFDRLDEYAKRRRKEKPADAEG